MMKAAIYARKSTDQNGVGDEHKSVPRQVDHAKAYARDKGWTVDERYIFTDDGISGAEFKNRRGFLRLMSALNPKPPFQVLIMSEESRLGREMVQTMGALGQLVAAGVRIHYYLEGKERTLDSPVEKMMMALETFGADMERDKASQRTRDAMVRKARAGHVTGGRCFGYDNHRIEAGHVERRVNPEQAAVVRRIFELCVQGHGKVAIAKTLNEEGALAPRSQQGRPRAWAASSVRAVLYRELYRGVIVWNKTQKRDSWGRVKQTARPEEEWLRIPAPNLRIVSDKLWEAAHARLEQTRGGLPPLDQGEALGPSPQRHRFTVSAHRAGPMWSLWWLAGEADPFPWSRREQDAHGLLRVQLLLPEREDGVPRTGWRCHSSPRTTP